MSILEKNSRWDSLLNMYVQKVVWGFLKNFTAQPLQKNLFSKVVNRVPNSLATKLVVHKTGTYLLILKPRAFEEPT